MELKEKTIAMEQSLHKVLKPFYKELLEQLSKEDKEKLINNYIDQEAGERIFLQIHLAGYFL